MQTDDKGILTEAVVGEILAADMSDDTTEYRYAGGAVHTVNVWPLLRAQVQATLDHLAHLSSQSDEELKSQIAQLTRDRFKQPAESAGLNWDENFNFMLASDIRSLIAPIMAARVEVALTKIANTYAKTIADLHKRLEHAVASIEQARVEERKEIGEKLLKIAGKNKSVMWFAEYLITGKTHQQLAEENYEEIMVLTYGQALKGEKPGVSSSSPPNEE